MLIKMYSHIIEPSVRELLLYATSFEKVDQAYRKYLVSPNQHLFGFKKGNSIVGCIGIELHGYNGVIKHIAVSPEERGNGIGSKMITLICEKYSLTNISAETDKDAVEFYRKFGFKVTPLGEKYPGVERYLCECNNSINNSMLI
ncbi:GNAT family N-acetyltransferase [Brevibacillus daliensis]|uniref:GNAT family N-acetyltransferase n=1 Tax=Brevibacillus daliensis TaxID=2892995 RepID=UPI001E65AE8F|nr:GNAT family N-acetyltransferase [Brevibacillus daliensis]